MSRRSSAHHGRNGAGATSREGVTERCDPSWIREAAGVVVARVGGVHAGARLARVASAARCVAALRRRGGAGGRAVEVRLATRCANPRAAVANAAVANAAVCRAAVTHHHAAVTAAAVCARVVSRVRGASASRDEERDRDANRQGGAWFHGTGKYRGSPRMPSSRMLRLASFCLCRWRPRAP